MKRKIGVNYSFNAFIKSTHARYWTNIVGDGNECGSGQVFSGYVCPSVLHIHLTETTGNNVTVQTKSWVITTVDVAYSFVDAIGISGSSQGDCFFIRLTSC